MTVYQNNHPNQQMGPSVYVYPVLPDAEEIMRECGLRLSFLSDSCGEKYLCTTEVKPEPSRNTATTAAYALAGAVKWLLTYELMLTGDIPTIEVHPSKFI